MSSTTEPNDSQKARETTSESSEKPLKRRSVSYGDLTKAQVLEAAREVAYLQDIGVIEKPVD